MKKIFKFTFAGIAAASLMAGAYSCDDNGGSDDSNLDSKKTATIEKYVNDVIVATYRHLADESMSLYDDCLALQSGTITQAKIDAACQDWIDARKYWELSEAFLYGPAADYYIDPHIDSWPLDKAQLDLALKNTTLINNMKNNGCNFSGFSTLGYGLLGFHAVEYMLFRDGGPRKVDGGKDSDGVDYGALTDTELIYCIAVAEDLRNQCIRLEASWAGMDNVSDEKQEILEDAELEPSRNYGENMIAAGESGNTDYKTQTSAYAEILQGMSDIADEVGNTKIAEPVSTQNVLDVESWYSWNSIDDFADNVRSIRNAYFGSMDGTVANSSVSTYIKSLDSALDTQLKAAIEKATTEIEAMPAPFRNNLTKAATDAAVNACNDLLDKIDEAIEALYK
ncbi:peptidase M75 [Alistipes sp. OttesenSCG-928-B03]|nr:peptidase M75 [Alistipes sp. OttesenSCG-928-B03]